MKKFLIFVNLFLIVFFLTNSIYASQQQADIFNNQKNSSSSSLNLNIPKSLNLIPTSNIYNNSQPKPINSLLNSPLNLQYYAQCGGNFDNYSLPNGCVLCQSGCGPTVAAMILSTYVNPIFTPSNVVDLYKKYGLYLGCDGSNISDAKQLLESQGLKTTDYLFYPLAKANENTVASDFRNYIKNGGWTMLALAHFSGIGHFIWVVDIDDQNNIYAYDSYYGRFEKPVNENQYNPQYKIAFGVKR